MSQSIAILVLGDPAANNSTLTALQFARSVLRSGHTIYRLFFYHDAVGIASSLPVYAQDEDNLPQQWQEFIAENKLDAVVCITAALRRGILDEKESDRYGKPAFNTNSGVELSGLGQWVEALTLADKYIVFGN